MLTKEYKFKATESSGDVSAILMRPENATQLFLFAHGAGAPMTHPSMEAYALALAEEKIATLRYNFPYTEQGKKGISPKPILYKTIRSAIDFAETIADGLTLIAGGKSMGGRMTSTVLSEKSDARIKGLVFFGFPLHAPGRDSLDRATHLFDVKIPMLFLQGDRDRLANQNLMNQLHKQLGKRSTLVLIAEADHSHRVPKKSGKTNQEILKLIANQTKKWINAVIQ